MRAQQPDRRAARSRSRTARRARASMLARLQVLARRLRLRRRSQSMSRKNSRPRAFASQSGSRGSGRLRARVAPPHLDARASRRRCFTAVGEVEPEALLQEGEHVAALAAHEAVVQRCFFGETEKLRFLPRGTGTGPRKSAPARLQLHVLADDRRRCRPPRARARSSRRGSFEVRPTRDAGAALVPGAEAEAPARACPCAASRRRARAARRCPCRG